MYRIRSVPGVARADNLILSYMQVSLPNGAEETAIVYAMEDFAKWGVPWSVTSGNVADLKRGDFVMFDESAARRFGPFAAGDYREVLGRRLKIIGTTREAKELYHDAARASWTSSERKRSSPTCSRARAATSW